MGLRGEALVQQLDLPARDAVRQRDIDPRAAHVAIPLRDLVGEVELITEDGGNDLGYGPVVLMRVVG